MYGIQLTLIDCLSSEVKQGEERSDKHYADFFLNRGKVVTFSFSFPTQFKNHTD